MTIRISSWNVNSVRARIEHVLDYLKADDAPDVILLQELKCQQHDPVFELLNQSNYNIEVVGQKTYNGVAILSKHPIEVTAKKLPGDDSDQQARYIEGLITKDEKVIRVASVYVPNGQDPSSDKFIYKLNFLERLQKHLKELLEEEEHLVIGGDYNIAPDELDVYNPEQLKNSICFHEKEHQAWNNLLSLGLYDAYRKINPKTQQFSWWDYRGNGWNQNKGMRIDHLLLSPEAADIAINSQVDSKWRDRKKPSDHAPIWCDFDFQTHSIK